MLKLLKCEKKDTIDSRREKILDYFWYTQWMETKLWYTSKQFISCIFHTTTLFGIRGIKN